MQQHRAIKQKYPDALLLFRVGDFYETFGEDAIHASRILGITLTKRNNGSASSSELAGFPHHALDTYLHKLVKGGFRVAICDQLEAKRVRMGMPAIPPAMRTRIDHGVTINRLFDCSRTNRENVAIPSPEMFVSGYSVAMTQVVGDPVRGGGLTCVRQVTIV